MKGHTRVCVKEDSGKWTYTCSCGRIRKVGLKYESSTTAIHIAHVRLMASHAKQNK